MTSSPVAERYTGHSVRRSEDPRILSGRGHYIDDVRLPGTLHAAFLRSPFPHASITSIDASAARDATGVVAVFTGVELELLVHPGAFGIAGMIEGMGGGPGRPLHTVLATDRARLVGDPVALVVAESRYLAEDACELIDVEYVELPAVAS
ncbi:MAG: xanthine dehydrogenase family protein molybdopterin-binding subunit, partial [Acidimicrobiia bacterium]